jgi:hypothetical protein
MQCLIVMKLVGLCVVWLLQETDTHRFITPFQNHFINVGVAPVNCTEQLGVTVIVWWVM